MRRGVAGRGRRRAGWEKPSSEPRGVVEPHHGDVCSEKQAELQTFGTVHCSPNTDLPGKQFVAHNPV